MFCSSEPTPYDVRFGLWGIPVRVHPFFWLFAALLGWNVDDLPGTALWIACVFVSVLVHELGHALTARQCGWRPHIVLTAFGGYAAYFPTWRISTAQRIGIIFAGPAAGFLLYSLMLALKQSLVGNGFYTPQALEIPLNFRLIQVVGFLLYINLWWSLFNLLPVYPLDGGQIMREVLGHWRRDGVRLALQISFAVACLGAVYFLFVLRPSRTFNGLLFASLAFDNYQMLNSRRY